MFNDDIAYVMKPISRCYRYPLLQQARSSSVIVLYCRSVSIPLAEENELRLGVFAFAGCTAIDFARNPCPTGIGYFGGFGRSGRS
jgi:hypothetical protein